MTSSPVSKIPSSFLLWRTLILRLIISLVCYSDSISYCAWYSDFILRSSLRLLWLPREFMSNPIRSSLSGIVWVTSWAIYSLLEISLLTAPGIFDSISLRLIMAAISSWILSWPSFSIALFCAYRIWVILGEKAGLVAEIWWPNSALYLLMASSSSATSFPTVSCYS